MCESESKNRGNSDARPTIGYLAPAIHGNYQHQWSGVVDAAQEFGANLLCFLGGSLNEPGGFRAQANVIYDLVASENVDGLASWASSIGNFVTVDEIRAFHEWYCPLPMVTIGRTLEGFSSLMMENYDGMREAIVHLIKVHGCRRLAFVRGPKDHFQAQERYRAYVETLETHGIPLDLNLVTPPLDWTRSTGEKLMRMLLDERNLRPQTDFEAVVAANDGLLFGVLNVLRERGIHVPRDVAIVGFDDTIEGRISTPPLTSVTAPFYELGYRTVEKLLALLEKAQVSQETIVPSKLMIRQSCGCKSSAVVQAAAELSPEPEAMQVGREGFEAALATRREGILAGMVEAVGELGESLHPEWAGRLLDGFVAELKGKSAGAFLAALDDILCRPVADDIAGHIIVAQDAVSVLRGHTLPILDGESLSQAENLWQQARVMIGEVVRRTQAHRALLVERQAAVLREVGQSLLTTFDLEGLTEGLTEGLPRLGIPSAYLSLYEDPKKPVGWSRLMLAYGPEGRAELDAGGVRFPSPQLVPEGMWPQGRRYSFVVKPLYFQDTQLGFILCEVGPRVSTVYETLGTQISNALQGALLVQRVRERSAELARQQYILDTFMENVPDSIYFKDHESRFTRINKALALHIEIDDPAEAVGKSDYDFFPEDQAGPKYEQEQEIIRTGQPVLDLEEPDGVGHWALTTKMPLRDENGEIIGTFGISRDITAVKEAQVALEKAYAEVERQVAERTAELQREQEESARLQQEVIEAQQRAIQELSTPIIPVLEGVIVMPLIGSIDTLRARDVTRSLLAGIREHKAKVVILDITGVPIVDSGVAAYLNKTVQAARLKGARTIVTGISEAVAETIVDLGIDWSGIETLRDLRTGLRAALRSPQALVEIGL